jgi:hypothetical protein
LAARQIAPKLALHQDEPIGVRLEAQRQVALAAYRGVDPATRKKIEAADTVPERTPERSARSPSACSTNRRPASDVEGQAEHEQTTLPV